MKSISKLIPAAFAGIALSFGVRVAAATGTEILVVDPRGNPVPSDIFRVDPSPTVRVGAAPHGRLTLPYACTPDMDFEAEPVPAGGFTDQSAYCESAGVLRIEVTPVYMVEQMKSNLKSALAASNHAAAAQIATELAARIHVGHGVEAAYYRNLAVAESARVISSKFNHSHVWAFGNVGAAIRGSSPNTNIRWKQLSKSTRLLTCTPAARPGTCKLVPTQRFQTLLDSTVSHPDTPHVVISPSWLQSFSHVTTSEILFDKLPKGAFSVANSAKVAPKE